MDNELKLQMLKKLKKAMQSVSLKKLDGKKKKQPCPEESTIKPTYPGFKMPFTK